MVIKPMNSEHKRALIDRLITSLIAVVVGSIVPVVFAIVTDLASAPKRLEEVERVLKVQAIVDSIQTAKLGQMSGDIRWLALVRCLDRTPRDPEQCARFNEERARR